MDESGVRSFPEAAGNPEVKRLKDQARWVLVLLLLCFASGCSTNRVALGPIQIDQIISEDENLTLVPPVHESRNPLHPRYFVLRNAQAVARKDMSEAKRYSDAGNPLHPGYYHPYSSTGWAAVGGQESPNYRSNNPLQPRGGVDIKKLGASRPLQHAYLFFSREGTEASYGMYTYVLFGPVPQSNLASLPRDVLQRYTALLSAITTSTDEVEVVANIGYKEERRNVFCVPAKTFSRTRTGLDVYDPVLGAQYRARALRVAVTEPEFAKRLALDAGPFLISTDVVLLPDAHSPMLLANLSSTHPDAMREVVAAYKLALTRVTAEDQQEMSRSGVFESLRLKLLNVILDAASNVRVMSYAIAEVIHSLDPMPSNAPHRPE